MCTFCLKIDSNALLLMEDSALKHYITAYGDRKKAIAFCTSQKRGDSSQSARMLKKKTENKTDSQSKGSNMSWERDNNSCKRHDYLVGMR